MDLKFGLKASAEQFGPRELVEVAVLADRAGLDSVYVSDHYQPWRRTGGHAPFSLSWMSAVGERTSNVSIGTSVLAATFRYNPAVIAQAFATLGCLYPGRVILGLGTGEALNETSVTGAAWPEFRERFARMREAVRLIRRLWTEDNVTFEGDYYNTVNATVFDKPESRVPIYVAAGGPQVARYAGRFGDGMICTSGKGMDLYADKLLPAVDEGLDKESRNSAEFDRTLEVKLSFDLDHQAALENTRFWAPLSLSEEEKRSCDDPSAMEKAADALPIEKIAQRWIVTADPEEVVEEVKPYVDLGLNHLIFHAPGHDQKRFIEQFTSAVLPKLRGLA